MFLRRVLRVLPGLLLPLLLGGCMMMASVEELYALPKLPREYEALGKHIENILSNGAETTSPTSGSHLQSVQIEDLDGDGTAEAIAFFRNNNDERPMKIYIFRAVNDVYEQAALIEGSGTTIYSISYLDMNGDGVKEILVSWRVGTQQALSVYALEDLRPALLMSAAYVRYATLDIDGDDMTELIVLRGDETETSSSLADCYDWDGASLILKSSARLSVAVSELQWMQIGALESGETAVFVTGRVAGVEETSRAVTDILLYRDGQLYNILLSQATGISSQIARYLGIHPTDIDGDDATEIPVPARLPVVENGEEMWKIYWFDYDADGEGVQSAMTYHNLTDSWYLSIPKEWDGRFTVVQENISTGEHATKFYSISGRRADELLFTIYTLTGDNRETLATRGDRIILRRQFSAVYVLEMSENYGDWRYAVAADELSERFNAIVTQWSTGEE
ncbi:MAG: VCBS repeat-containing protein [Oscillospiraceae bacterium]|nr:VCBS repeat-containing protein [Oscillospiraceae bacterium]